MFVVAAVVGGGDVGLLLPALEPALALAPGLAPGPGPELELELELANEGCSNLDALRWLRQAVAVAVAVARGSAFAVEQLERVAVEVAAADEVVVGCG